MPSEVLSQKIDGAGRLKGVNTSFWGEASEQDRIIADIGADIENNPIAAYILDEPAFRLQFACWIVVGEFRIIRDKLDGVIFGDKRVD